jgi:hypothetical protein
MRQGIPHEIPAGAKPSTFGARFQRVGLRIRPGAWVVYVTFR